jgi:GDP-L-fucose synthase
MWIPRDDFWNGKRVMVTGASGFLGSFLLERLQTLQQTQLSFPTSQECDLRDPVQTRAYLEQHSPHVVIHLAANVGGIGANAKRPAEFFYDNLMMGVPLLHASWELGVEKFVSVGTVCCYPKNTPTPFKESDLWNGYPEETNAPYGLAKKMLLVAGDAYRSQYGFKSIFLLPVNLYGPRDNFDPASSHVIPALVKKCIDAKEAGEPSITVWGTGKATREFLYVEDAADGILKAADSYDDEKPVNLGSSNEISIRDLVEQIRSVVGFPGEIVWDSSFPDGQPRRKLDVTRARESFGFQSQTGFEDGLRQTVDWYLKHRQEQSAAPVSSRKHP